MSLNGVEVAEMLQRAFMALLDKNVIPNETFSTVGEVSAQLKGSHKTSGGKCWSYDVGPGAPIVFNRIQYEADKFMLPVITVKKIEVNCEAAAFPYKAWDLTLEIVDPFERLPEKENEDTTEYFTKGMKPLARWHSDLANPNQAGPRVHLQYGGHFRGAREFDSPLKAPRWMHHPMDLILMSEVVTANFFTEQWLELRTLRGWCEAVHLAQALCCKPFFSYIQRKMELSSTTILCETWNDRWCD